MSAEARRRIGEAVKRSWAKRNRTDEEFEDGEEQQVAALSAMDGEQVHAILMMFGRRIAALFNRRCDSVVVPYAGNSVTFQFGDHIDTQTASNIVRTGQ